MGSAEWEGDITSIRWKQTLDQAQVKVMGQAFANTVTGAYHTVVTLGIAVDDAHTTAGADLLTGVNAAVSFVLVNAADHLDLTDGIVTDVEVSADVDGAIVGTLEVAGNSAAAMTGA
jgi:hypothetical protein